MPVLRKSCGLLVALSVLMPALMLAGFAGAAAAQETSGYEEYMPESVGGVEYAEEAVSSIAEDTSYPYPAPDPFEDDGRTYSYDEDPEGTFHGVRLPERVFNNIPSRFGEAAK